MGHLVCLVVAELEEVHEERQHLPGALAVHVPHSGNAQGKGLQGGVGETEWGDGVRGCEGVGLYV